jgi:pyridoxal 5'-phosphate synthase pdxS subunit
MALERVPADIRKEGGVARMAPITKIREIHGGGQHPGDGQGAHRPLHGGPILEALKVDYIDESEVLTPADEEHHIDKRAFKVPFVCGARNLGEALRRIGEGAA